MADSEFTTLGIDALARAQLHFYALAHEAPTVEIGAALRLAADITDSLSDLRNEVSEVIIRASGDNFDIVDAVRELRRALEETAKVEACPLLNPSGYLLVTFSREGETELMQTCENGDRALKAALIMLAQQDALRAGDKITVEWHRRPTLIEQGLA
jgi:hypothetical protein